MITLTVKGLANYITSAPAAQQRVLRDFKYPKEDEATAKRLYYRDATERISAFHRGKDRSWLLAEADSLAKLAALNGGPAGVRLRHNARAVRQYEQAFGDRIYDVHAPTKLSLVWSGVRVKVTPDLDVEEKGKRRLIKLDFSEEEPSTEIVKIVSQIMFESAASSGLDIPAGSVLYVDVCRGREHRGARLGARVRRDIEAACETIAQVWDSIRPPR